MSTLMYKQQIMASQNWIFLDTQEKITMASHHTNRVDLLETLPMDGAQRFNCRNPSMSTQILVETPQRS